MYKTRISLRLNNPYVVKVDGHFILFPNQKTAVTVGKN